jgi:hypothetical protein
MANTSKKDTIFRQSHASQTSRHLPFNPKMRKIYAGCTLKSRSEQAKSGKQTSPIYPASLIC